MKITFIDFLKSAFVQRDEKYRQKLSIFLICLLISIIIWFTIKLSDEYDTVIQVPVTFTQLPKNKVMTFVSDTVLHVEVIEKGSNLFRMLYVDQIEPVAISLRFLPVYPKNGIYQGIISPSLLINEIEREQNLLGKVISISPDTIYLSFEPEMSEKIPVTADFDLSFEKQYMRYGQVVFYPDCVLVRGPQRRIEEMDSVSLGKISLHQLNQNYTGERAFPRDSNHRNLTFIPDKVSFTIPVEKFTEATTTLPVAVMGTQGAMVRIFPDKVKVYYTVALKDYPKIEPGMFGLVADFSDLNLLQEDKVKVLIDNQPPGIRINKLEPEKVEFIIIK